MRCLVEAGSAAIFDAGSEGRVLAGSAAVAGTSLSGLAWDAGTNALTATFEASVAAWAAADGASLSLFIHDGQAGVELEISDGTAGGGGTELSWAVAGAADRALLAGIGEDERFLALVATSNPNAGTAGVETGQTAREARMLHAVRAQLNRRDVRPMGDIVTVSAAALAAWNLTATIEAGAGADAATVLDAAIEAARAYGAQTRRVGAAVRLGGLYAALYRPGVIDVTITEPAADIAAAAGTAPQLGTVQVTLR